MNIEKLTMTEEYHSVFENCINFMMDALLEYLRCVELQVDTVMLERDVRKALMKNILIENE